MEILLTTLLMHLTHLTIAGRNFYLQCPFCPKVFVSNDYLLAHIPRRHSEHGSQFVGALKDSGSDARRGREHDATINDDLLRELKDIKERMISTERQLQKERESDHLAEVMTISRLGIRLKNV